jgi:hypothetical protein
LFQPYMAISNEYIIKYDFNCICMY